MQCINQKELTQLIHKEKPQLETLLQRDPLIATQSILDWTANVTPIALSKQFFDKTKNINRMAAEEIYKAGADIIIIGNGAEENRNLISDIADMKLKFNSLKSSVIN